MKPHSAKRENDKSEGDTNMSKTEPAKTDWTIMLSSSNSKMPYAVQCGQALGYVDPADQPRIGSKED